MTEKKPPFNFEEFINLVKARNPLVHAVTYDEWSFIEFTFNNLTAANEDLKKEQTKDVFVWSAYTGVLNQEDIKADKLQTEDNAWLDPSTKSPMTNPMQLLNAIAKHKTDDKKDGSIFILKEINNSFIGTNIPRAIRDLLPTLRKQKKTIVILSPQLTYAGGGQIKSGVEPSLEKNLSIYRMNLPSYGEIKDFIEANINASKSMQSNDKVAAAKIGNRKMDYTTEEFADICKSLQGLHLFEIAGACRKSIATKNELNTTVLQREKKDAILKSDILEYIESKGTFDNVGGLDQLKAFANDYKNCYSEEAIEFGVEPLKGILLTGVPGVGKSLSAKTLGNTWGIPTLRLDIGKVMQGIVGGSEAKMREVVNTAQSCAPVVLWLDEIEKALSGTASSNFSDSGTLSRVFGTLLTAMEEGLKGVTLIATANDITQLPPELIRRFNEVFFVDLPTEEERKEIFGIHLRQRKQDPANFDLDKLAKASDTFTGSEIEKVIKDGIARSFNNNKTPLHDDLIVEICKTTKPIADVMAEKIKGIKDWAKNRAKFASSLQEAKVKNNNCEPGTVSNTPVTNLPEIDI